MKKVLDFFRRLFKPDSEEKVLLAYNREVLEAIKRKNEAMYRIYDIVRYGPMNK